MMQPIRKAILWSCALLCSLSISCSDENQPAKGSVSFSFANKTTPGARIQETASKLLISIKDAQGVLVHDKEEIDLFNFEGEFISEPLVLGIGSYTLVEFIVLNANNEVIYVCPIEESSLAYLVELPLPIAFEVEKDEVTNLVPEVISAEGHSAIDFGYTAFGFNVANTLKFLSAAFIYNTTTGNLELADHHLLVKSGTDTLYYGSQSNATSTTTVRSDFENYTLTFSKSGYLPVVRNYTKETLMSDYQSSPINIVFLPVSITNGLIAFYPFNGNANDASGSNFNGTINGPLLTTDKNGQANSAYAFDGVNDLIRIPHNNAFNFAGSDFSISLWAFIPADQISHSGINDMIRKWNGTAEGYPFSISYTNIDAPDADEDKLLFARYDGQGCSGTSSSFSGIIDNTLFHHIVMIKENTSIRYYINNTLITSFTDISSCSTSNTADVTFGARGQEVRFFKGKLDNIRFYNRALTDQEISNLFLSE